MIQFENKGGYYVADAKHLNWGREEKITGIYNKILNMNKPIMVINLKDTTTKYLNCFATKILYTDKNVISLCCYISHSYYVRIAIKKDDTVSSGIINYAK